METDSDFDWWNYSWETHMVHGSCYDVIEAGDRPKLPSVSHAAHVAMSKPAVQAKNPIGFAIPKKVKAK